MTGRGYATLTVILALVTVAGIGAALILVNRQEAGQPLGQSISTSPTTSSAAPVPKPKPKPEPKQRPVLAIKIDNVGLARPHTGLAAAKAIYVEPVEGGLTRLAALYTGKLPPTVGPVRSARETDIGILTQYGRPVLAFSGAAPKLLRLIRKSPIIQASPGQAGRAYFRKPGRPSVHDMFVHPRKLPKAKPPNIPQVMRFGATPAGGAPDRSLRVRYPGATYLFTWSPKAKRWLVTMDGAPLVSTGAGQLRASTVIVQRVRFVRGHGIIDTAGNPSPVAKTIGKGSATVYRDGKRFAATWTRPTMKAPTKFTTRNGKPLPMASGQVWILLVRA